MTTFPKTLFWSLCIGFLLLSGCRRSGLQVQEVFHMLSVGDVVLVTSGDWSSKSSQSSKSSDSSLVARSAEFAEVALGDGLSLSAEEGWIGDLAHADLSDSTLAQQHVDFVSKGTPITNASGVNSFLIQLFNSGSAAWGAGVPLTESFTATKGGNSYSLSSSYNWLSDTDKVSLFAFTPVPSADNGLSVGANGYTVRYVVPTDVAKQPDLSSALAQTNVINTDGKQHMRNFNFDHRLTAVGVAIHGWNVKVTKVEVLGVSFGGTYDLSSGVWALDAALGSRTMGVNSDKVPTDGYLAGDKTWTDATNANGYMMMIPQALAPTAQLKVTYEGMSGNTDKGTITANISGLTGGAWRAGGKVTYNIQFKMAPNISTTALTMPWKAGYTTALPVVFGTHDPADRYTFSWSDTWNTLHSGAAKVGDVGGGSGSGFGVDATSVTDSRQIWFYTKVDYATTSTNRTSTVTVSGRRTAAKSFVVTQTRKPSVVVSPAVPTESPVASGGKTYTVNVKSNYPWKATSTAGGVTIDPAIGTNAEGTPAAGTNVTITVPVNNDAASRAVGAWFETTNDGGVAALVLGMNWAGTQAGLVLAGSDPAAIAQPDKSTTVLSFTGNPSVAWSISAPPAWITASPASGTAPAAAAQNVTLTATENATGAVRTGVLAIKMGSVTRNFTITQNASSISISTGTASMIAATSSAQAFTVTVGSGTPWTVTNTSGGWLTNTTEKGTGNGAAQGVMLAATANNTDKIREATVTVTAGGKTVTCKVTQAAPVIGDFVHTFVNYNGAAGLWASGNKAVTPASGLQWKLTGDTGVTVSPTASPQTGAVTNASASVGANNTNFARTLKYYIWYGALSSLKTEYTIAQAAPDVTISALSQSVVWNATSATFNVVVPANSNGVIYTPVAGAHATGVAPSGAQTVSVSGAGSHTKAVTVNFTANTGAARNIVATVKYGASLTKTHTINQAGGLVIDNTAPGGTIRGSGQEYTVKVTAGSAWTAVASAGTTVSPANGTGAATVKITVAANPSATATRAAKVDFKLGSAVLATWSGTQAVADVALNLSSSSASVAARDETTTFTVTSNVPFTPTYSSGAGSDLGTGVQQPVTGKSVTMSFPGQGSRPAVARNHTMTFTPNPNNPASSQTRVFTVTQAAVPPTLTITSSDPGQTIPKAGERYGSTLLSNTTYTITATNATVTDPSGLGIYVIEVNPSPPGTATREVKVVFTTTDNAGHPAVTRTWTGTQELNPPADCYDTPLPGFYKLYVAKADILVGSNWNIANGTCDAWGGRLPKIEELKVMYTNKASYATFADTWYWSSSRSSDNSYAVLNFFNGEQALSPSSTRHAVRCVKHLN